MTETISFAGSGRSSSSQRSSPSSGSPDRKLDRTASILILGDPKTGKSTLAVIAAAAFRRRLVDFCDFFQQRTGLTQSAFENKYGHAELRSQKHILLKEMLQECDRHHVVVCPTNCLQPATQSLMKDFSLRHPVIHITSNLGRAEDFKNAVLDGAPRDAESNYRLCQSVSNYEYYNLFEISVGSKHNSSDRLSEHMTTTYTFGYSFLRLKRAEQDFLRFLRSILTSPRYGRINKTQHDPPSARTPFTYALSLTLPELLTGQNLEGLLCDGADAVEMRIDLNDTSLHQCTDTGPVLERISRGFSTVRRVFHGPIVYHVQKLERPRPTQAEQDYFSAAYLALVQHGLRLCPDFLTVDLSSPDNTIMEITHTKSPTTIIGHFHESSPLPDAWVRPERTQTYYRARELGCHMVRLTQVAHSLADNLSVQLFIRRVQGPEASQYDLIAYNTGPLGRTSCCFNQIYSAVAPTLSRRVKPTDPLDPAAPLITMQEAQAALYASFVLNKLRFYIIGTDVSSALAPHLYRAAFKHLGMPHTFEPQSMASIRELQELMTDDFGGATIAQGLKISALSSTQRISHHAEIIGAVNTLVPIRGASKGSGALPFEFWRNRDQSLPIQGLYGENIDWVGMYRSISKRLSPANSVTSRTTGLVMGAGGMARAAVYAMIRLGVRHIFIYNRTVAKAYSLAEHYNSQSSSDTDSADDPSRQEESKTPRKSPTVAYSVRVIESLDQPWPEGYSQPTIVVCCIRAAVELNAPQPEITVPAQWLRSSNGGVVIDTCYEPLLSPLIRQISRLSPRGWIPVDGLQLLPEHAVAQFELFTGRRVPHIRMCIAVLENYRSRSAVDAETEKLIEIRLKDLYEKLDLKPTTSSEVPM